MDAERWCADCGAGLRWVVTIGGRRRELEATPHPAGNHVVRNVRVVGGGTGVRVRVLTGHQMPAQEPAYRIHRCPADDKPQPILCAICGHEMTRDIALQLGWTTHPGCDLDTLENPTARKASR